MFKKILQVMKLSSRANDDKEKRVINTDGLVLGGEVGDNNLLRRRQIRVFIGLLIVVVIILGFLTAIAHFSFSKAYQLAEVTFLMPIGFIKFFLSTLIGYLAFAEIPYTPSSWIGMIIIFFSILLLEDSISLRSWIKLTN